MICFSGGGGDKKLSLKLYHKHDEFGLPIVNFLCCLGMCRSIAHHSVSTF